MKKATILCLTLICLLFLSACAGSKTTELAVKLETPSDISSAAEKNDEKIEVSAVEQDSPEAISLSIDFSPEQARIMSNFSNGGLYYTDEMLYGRLCPISGNYLRLGAIKISDDGEYVHSGTPFFLDDDILPSYVCSSGETLYYVRKSNSTEALSIAGVNKDGGNPVILYEGGYCNYLQIHNGRLYFTNEDNYFVSTDMNGSDSQIILSKEVFFPYFIDDEWILYQDDADSESLHLFSVSSCYDIKLNDMRSYTPVITGSDLFYLGVPDGKTNRHLCHIDLSGIKLEVTDGITEYMLEREVDIGEEDVYDLFMDGTYIYGANNTVAPISDWKEFTDDGYSYLSERYNYLHDGWAICIQLNSNGAVKNIFLRKLTTDAVSMLPRVYG